MRAIARDYEVLGDQLSGSLDCFLTDIGTWEMKITQENGTVHVETIPYRVKEC